MLLEAEAVVKTTAHPTLGSKLPSVWERNQTIEQLVCVLENTQREARLLDTLQAKRTWAGL